MAEIEFSVELGSHRAALLHCKSDRYKLSGGLCLITGVLLLTACEKMFCGLVTCRPASSQSSFTSIQFDQFTVSLHGSRANLHQCSPPSFLVCLALPFELSLISCVCDWQVFRFGGA